jgi:hypothetical protein
LLHGASTANSDLSRYDASGIHAVPAPARPAGPWSRPCDCRCSIVVPRRDAELQYRYPLLCVLESGDHAAHGLDLTPPPRAHDSSTGHVGVTVNLCRSCVGFGCVDTFLQDQQARGGQTACGGRLDRVGRLDRLYGALDRFAGSIDGRPTNVDSGGTPSELMHVGLL